MLNLITSIKSLTSKTQEKLAKILIDKNLQIATAESCTGGLVSSRLTDVGGSSAFVKLNLVTYSNDAKQEFLGVKKETLEKYGAVSEQCAREMAEGLVKKTGCDVAICTTGIAGPTGDGFSEGRRADVGLIYISVAYKGTITVEKFTLNPAYNRKNMKFMFSEKALQMAIRLISK